MCQFRFNYKRMIFFSAVLLIDFIIGVSFSKSWQIFSRPNETIVKTQSKVENVSEVPKVYPKEMRLEQTRICEEIKNYYSYKAKDKRYIEGGVLNGKSCFVEPVYSKEAIENAISGQVNVEVLVDGLGIIRSAKAISGPELLRKSSVEATYKTKILPQ
jgi:predicted PP-loop superfamily ATPase